MCATCLVNKVCLYGKVLISVNKLTCKVVLRRQRMAYHACRESPDTPYSADNGAANICHGHSVFKEGFHLGRSHYSRAWCGQQHSCNLLWFLSQHLQSIPLLLIRQTFPQLDLFWQTVVCLACNQMLSDATHKHIKSMSSVLVHADSSGGMWLVQTAQVSLVEPC